MPTLEQDKSSSKFKIDASHSKSLSPDSIKNIAPVKEMKQHQRAATLISGMPSSPRNKLKDRSETSSGLAAKSRQTINEKLKQPASFFEKKDPPSKMVSKKQSVSNPAVTKSKKQKKSDHFLKWDLSLKNQPKKPKTNSETLANLSLTKKNNVKDKMKKIETLERKKPSTFAPSSRKKTKSKSSKSASNLSAKDYTKEHKAENKLKSATSVTRTEKKSQHQEKATRSKSLLAGGKSDKASDLRSKSAYYKTDTNRHKFVKPKESLNQQRSKSPFGQKKDHLAKKQIFDNKLAIMMIEKMIDSPSSSLPWLWHSQCWNDRVQYCSPYLQALNDDIYSHPAAKVIQHFRQTHSSFTAPEVRVIGTIMRIIADIPEKEHPLPFYYYMALEMMLGLGFVPSRFTSIQPRQVDLDILLTTHDSMIYHLTVAVRLGLHRLLSGLLDLKKAHFQIYGPELRGLLYAARDQPFALAQLLRRITDEQVKYMAATECRDCGPLAQAIHSLLTIKVPAHIQSLCLPTGEQSSINISTHLSQLSQKLSSNDRIMLARAFLFIIFDVPFCATSCPKCTRLHADSRQLANTMLTCYCTPHSALHFI